MTDLEISKVNGIVATVNGEIVVLEKGFNIDEVDGLYYFKKKELLYGEIKGYTTTEKEMYVKLIVNRMSKMNKRLNEDDMTMPLLCSGRIKAEMLNG